MLDNLVAVLSAFPFTFGLIIGLVVGSFLNVVIYRLPKGMSLNNPGSHCFSCKRPVALYDNIPILSYLILKGRCRHCKAAFSWRYAAVEMVTGVLTGLAAVTLYEDVGLLLVAWIAIWVFISCALITYDNAFNRLA